MVAASTAKATVDSIPTAGATPVTLLYAAAVFFKAISTAEILLMVFLSSVEDVSRLKKTMRRK